MGGLDVDPLDLRLFVALWLPEALAKAPLARLEQLRPGSTGVRWVRPNQLHLTLKFLGATSPRHLSGIQEALQYVAKASHPIELGLSSSGVFPPGRAAARDLAGCHARTGLGRTGLPGRAGLESTGVSARETPVSAPPHARPGGTGSGLQPAPACPTYACRPRSGWHSGTGAEHAETRGGDLPERGRVEVGSGVIGPDYFFVWFVWFVVKFRFSPPRKPPPYRCFVRCPP